MEISNLFTVETELGMEHDGFRIRETQIGPQLGADPIGGSVYDIDPGKKLWPYHLHHANEEWLVVLRGRPTLRTPEGERKLVEGDVACFPRGATGAHLLRNVTLPLVTMVGVQAATSLGGVVFIESVFDLPGLGGMLRRGAQQRDLPLTAGSVLFLALAIMVLNLLVDILYGWLDPRIRAAARAA